MIKSQKAYKQISPQKNKYFLVRHTECMSNIKKISSYNWEKEDILTKTGIKQAENLANKLKNYKIDLIFCSPFTRTKQTLEIINKELKIDSKKIFFDKKLVDNNFGISDGKHYDEYHKLFSSEESYFETLVPYGENYADVKKRVSIFLKKVESKYKNKKILIVSHGFPLRMLELVAMDLNIKECIKHLRDSHFVQREEIRPLKFKK